MKLAAELSKWYRRNKRNLPWRNTKDPYRIWLSEIMLQQTRVNQGLPYYLRFIEKYPDLHSLARASENDVLNLWQGLGYYSRARNMLHCAKEIEDKLNGKFPDDFDGLINLKGIGSYSAAAIASFAFGKPHAVLDGNVCRFISRYFGIKDSFYSAKGKKKFTRVAQELLDQNNPAEHNQAIMEFGALCCTPVNPKCIKCPFRKKCYAYRKNKIHLLPSSKKKISGPKVRFFNYYHISWKKRFLVHQRTASDIWKNLFELPLYESDYEIIKPLLFLKKTGIILTKSNFKLMDEQRAIHRLSHQLINAKFVQLESAIKPEFDPVHYKLISVSASRNLAFPRLIEKFLMNQSSVAND